MVAAQNFTCVGCGTPIESSKYYQKVKKPNKSITSNLAIILTNIDVLQLSNYLS